VNGLEHVCTLHVCRATDEIFFFPENDEIFHNNNKHGIRMV
jgi:hypothetical protein